MIRNLAPSDRELYKTLISEFYSSPAVLHSIPESHIDKTFDELMRSDCYAECFIIECDGEPAGYALIAKSFSQEAGGLTVWLDEFYVREKYRGKGLGKSFLDFFLEIYSGKAARLRLETEPDNKRAAVLYASYGFTPLDYRQMVVEYGD